jgi:murein DD-endopeptidase MepM/ murein hydrolase activator NlpD
MFSKRNFSIGGFKFRWIALSSTLLGIVLFTAFNEAPQAETHPSSVRTVNQLLDLPRTTTAFNPNEVFWQIEQVHQGDSLYTLFDRLNIKDIDAIKLLMADPKANAIDTMLQVGHTIKLKTNSNGKLLHLEYEIDAETILTADLVNDEFQVSTQQLALKSQEVFKTAVIRDSLFGATDAADIPDQIAMQIAEVLADQIDFFHDLRTGDYFNVVYEAYYNAGNLIKTGNLLAVEFVNKGKVYQAIHFGEKSGKYTYYSPDGKSLHKSFLRSPLEFTRISSSFSLGRFHPILNRIKAHKGVDMAAPLGTRIMASGEGVVKFVGKKGGYGNVIILAHPEGISTVYGHLSRFAQGLHRGEKVEQGDIIGYVGMTGLATGPHLHYEFLQKGVHKDPMKVALPKNFPLKNHDLAEFKKISQQRMAQLEMLDKRAMTASAK